MTKYTIKLGFTNLDNSLYTNAQAKMFFDIEADDYKHAQLLAEHLERMYRADWYIIE